MMDMLQLVRLMGYHTFMDYEINLMRTNQHKKIKNKDNRKYKNALHINRVNIIL